MKCSGLLYYPTWFLIMFRCLDTVPIPTVSHRCAPWNRGTVASRGSEQFPSRRLPASDGTRRSGRGISSLGSRRVTSCTPTDTVRKGTWIHGTAVTKKEERAEPLSVTKNEKNEKRRGKQEENEKTGQGQKKSQRRRRRRRGRPSAVNTKQ